MVPVADRGLGHRRCRHSGAEEGPPRAVVHLLGGALDVKHVAFAQVDVFIQEERGQVALEVSAVLHHHSAGHRVTSDGRTGVRDRQEWGEGSIAVKDNHKAFTAAAPLLIQSSMTLMEFKSAC